MTIGASAALELSYGKGLKTGVQKSMAKTKKKEPLPSDGFDWVTIRSEYVTKNFTYSALCEKHGCSMSTLTKRASAEGWANARKKHRKKVERKIEEKAAAKKAEKAVKEMSKTEELAEVLLEWIEKAITELDEHEVEKRKVTKKVKFTPNEDEDLPPNKNETTTEKINLETVKSIVKVDDLKKLSATLKDIRDVIASDDENKDSTLTVILEGALKEYGK